MDAAYLGMSNNQVLATVGMPRRAMCFLHVDRYAALPSSCVFFLGYCLKVIWVYAATVRAVLKKRTVALVMTRMVNDKAISDWSVVQLIGESVSMSATPFPARLGPFKDSVSAWKKAPGPLPAGVRFFHKRPKSLGLIVRLRGRLRKPEYAKPAPLHAILVMLLITCLAAPPSMSFLGCIVMSILLIVWVPFWAGSLHGWRHSRYFITKRVGCHS